MSSLLSTEFVITAAVLTLGRLEFLERQAITVSGGFIFHCYV